MRRANFVSILPLVLALSLSAFATAIQPTTTLKAETSNNTSTAATWTTSINGNVGATNVSKVPHRTLLYPGATTKIYTNIMHWFGPANHIQVGYNSGDPAQIRKQVDDHVSRGIDGTIVDWYSTHHTLDNNATFEMMRYAETLPGLPFSFAIMEDKGALLPCANTAGCNVSQALVNDLNYIWANFAQSPVYMRANDGRPVVFFFGLEQFSINWSWVRANAPANLAFIFQNSGGFSNAVSDGAYGWVMINTADTNDWKQSYLNNFYWTAKQWPTKHPVGATWKGFDDRLASWSLNRVMAQQCGQVWLNTWKEVARHYSESNQLEMMQIVTWNDYEEGTSIETGIDNCFSLTASVSGNVLGWTITGQENTIDHYQVFASTDGVNLAPLAQVAAGIRQIDLTPFNLDAGGYKLFVKAVGKPSFVNRMSNAASWTSSFSTPGVSIATPGNGATVKTPVRLAAKATAAAGATITATRIYVDGQEWFAVSADAVDTKLAIPAGARTVAVQATDNLGAVYTSSLALTVVDNKPPLATVAVTPANGAVAPVTVTISSNGSVDPDGTVVATTLKCGGMDHAGPVATHTFSAPGTYDIVAEVTDDSGATSTSVVTLNVAAAGVTVQQPTPAAAVSDPNVRFVASALAPTGRTISAMRIYVDSVDRYSVNAAALDTFLNLTTGAHTVHVQAWDTTGAVYKSVLTVNVQAANQPPSASVSATPARVESGATVTATVAATDADGRIASYSIDFGDGFVATTQSAAHAYAKPGTYTVRATVTDDRGATATATTTVTVLNRAPSVSLSFSGNSIVAGQSVTASITASDPDGHVASYAIDFGDGFVATSATATRTYTAAGTYTVRATVIDNSGASATATAQVVVNAPAQAVTQTPGVKVLSPISGTTVASQVRFQAVATPAAGRVITAIKIYVDGKVLYSTTSAAVDAYLSLKSGTRSVVVQAWDSGGNVYKQSLTLSVTAARTASLKAANTRPRLIFGASDSGLLVR